MSASLTDPLHREVSPASIGRTAGEGAPTEAMRSEPHDLAMRDSARAEPVKPWRVERNQPDHATSGGRVILDFASNAELAGLEALFNNRWSAAATAPADAPRIPVDGLLPQVEAWLRQCSTWMLTNDLDMGCPMEADPLDLADALANHVRKVGRAPVWMGVDFAADAVRT